METIFDHVVNNICIHEHTYNIMVHRPFFNKKKRYNVFALIAASLTRFYRFCNRVMGILKYNRVCARNGPQQYPMDKLRTPCSAKDLLN